MRQMLKDKENLDTQKKKKRRNSSPKGPAQKQRSLPRRFSTNMAESRRKTRIKRGDKVGRGDEEKKLGGAGMVWSIYKNG